MSDGKICVSCQRTIADVATELTIAYMENASLTPEKLLKYISYFIKMQMKRLMVNSKRLRTLTRVLFVPKTTNKRGGGMNEKADLAHEDYLKGLKYKEIAEKYNVSLSTVKSWATRYWKQKGCNQSKSCNQKERCTHR